jgi:hypothetical protein
MVAYDPTPYNLYCVTLSLQLDNVEHVFVKEVSAKLTKIATDNENFFTLSKKIDVARIEVFAFVLPMPQRRQVMIPIHHVLNFGAPSTSAEVL